MQPPRRWSSSGFSAGNIVRKALALTACVLCSAKSLSPAEAPDKQHTVSIQVREYCASHPNDKAEMCRKLIDSEAQGTVGLPPGGGAIANGGADNGDGPAFCKAEVPACDCVKLNNHEFLRCKYLLCRYQPGFYAGKNLRTLAERIGKALGNEHRRNSVQFTGFADGTSWKGIVPKPQPIQASVRQCLVGALELHKDKLRNLDQVDYRDASLALLRGCALELAIRRSKQNFSLSAERFFSFSGRVPGVKNDTARAAQLEILTETSCGGSQRWTTRPPLLQ